MSSLSRKIERNEIKEKQGNNKIRKAWRIHQVDKYSVEGYSKMTKTPVKDIYKV